jgi:hypothetical protein
MRGSCNMLIQVGRRPRAKDVRSEFWSRGLFCIVRYKLGQESWGHIRLWRGHPWQTCETTLQLIAAHRVSQSQYSRVPSDAVSIELAVSGTWVVFRYSDAHLQLPKGYRMLPDRYWYKWRGKLDTSDYSRAVVSTESMCCYLCSVMHDATRRS